MITNTFPLTYVLNGDGRKTLWTVSHQEHLNISIILTNNQELMLLDGMVVQNGNRFYLLTNAPRTVGEVINIPEGTDIQYSLLRHVIIA